MQVTKYYICLVKIHIHKAERKFIKYLEALNLEKLESNSALWPRAGYLETDIV